MYGEMNNPVKWTMNRPGPYQEPRKVKLLGKASLHMVFHSLTTQTKYEA